MAPNDTIEKVKVSSFQFEILKVIEAGPLVTFEIEELVPASMKGKNITSMVRGAEAKGLLECDIVERTAPTKGRKNLLQSTITALGRDVLKHPEKYEIAQANSAKTKKKSKSKPPARAQTEIEAPTMNISETADQLVNVTTNLIHENSSYREYLLKVATQTADFLGLQLVPKGATVITNQTE